jgi:hypothetical protein
VLYLVTVSSTALLVVCTVQYLVTVSSTALLVVWLARHDICLMRPVSGTYPVEHVLPK